jgi:hypothetical protein
MRAGTNGIVAFCVSRGLVSFIFAYASPKHSDTNYFPLQATGSYSVACPLPLVGGGRFWAKFSATAPDTVVRAGGSSIRSSQHL